MYAYTSVSYLKKCRMGVGTEGTRDSHERREDEKAGLAY